jgi:hypothetical protein
VQADHQSAVIVDATASVNNSGCDRTRITSASPQLSDVSPDRSGVRDQDAVNDK